MGRFSSHAQVGSGVNWPKDDSPIQFIILGFRISCASLCKCLRQVPSNQWMRSYAEKIDNNYKDEGFNY